ncbi:MAG: nucleotide exchange factor GrpE [Planctomycetota bacterium]
MVRRTKRKRDAVAAESPPEVAPPPPAPDGAPAPAAPAAETPAARAERLEAESAELRDRLLRAQADFQNLRRRAALDCEAGLQRALQPLFADLLLVLDYLDLALAAPATTEEAKNLALGVEMTRLKLLQSLEQAEVRPIAAEGIFDPALHEAAGTRVEPGAVPGTVIETVRRGYRWRESVLRHAQVIVAAAERMEEEEGKEGEDRP